MIKELAEYLNECEIEIRAVEDLSLPIAKEEHLSLLILPNYNILEMMEEAVEDADSLSSYVNHELEEASGLQVDDAWQRIVEAELACSDLSPEQKDMNGKDFEEIFKAYALLWEDSPLLNEQISDSAAEPFSINSEWIEQRSENDEIIILHLPVRSGYEAPLWIPMGGFNECPLPQYQSLIFKHWQDRYDITPLAVSEDTWIIQAGKCPETEEEALRLAKEHFIFCSYVLEGYPTLGHYANDLMKHKVWHFWWD